MGRHLRAHAEWYWAPALYALCVCALYAPVLGGAAGFGWDTTESYWPDLIFLSDQLAQGEWPLWNPFDRGGYPFYADPQSSIMYPVQWLFAVVGAICGGVSWELIQAKMLVHQVLAAALMHLYLRSRGLEKSAAIVGGVTWIASAPWLIHKASNILLPMSWVPLVWLAIDRFHEEPGARRALLLSAALCLPGSAGSPPGFFYALLLIGSYGLYRLAATVLERRRQGTLHGYGRRWLGAGTLAVLVSVCLLLITVVPGLDLAELTARQARGLGYSLSFSLPVRETILGLWVPAAGKADAYMGLFAMAAATIALFCSARRDSGIAIFFAASAAFYLLLAFGSATPVLGWLVEHVPGFGLFRAANRYKLLFAVVMSALAAYGASTAIRSTPKISRDNIRIAGAVLFGLALITALAFKLPATEPRGPAPTESLWLGLASAIALIGAGWHDKRAAAMVLVVSAALIAYDADHFWHWRGKILEPRVELDAGRERLDALPDAGKSLRIYDEYQLEHRAGSRLGLRDFRGYPSGDPLDLSRYRDILTQLDERPELLAAYNVGYVLSGPHHRNRTSKNHLRTRPSVRRPKLFAAAGPVDVVRSPAPWLAWYNTTLTIDRDRALEAVAIQARREPDARIAIVEPAAAAALGSAREALESPKTLLSGRGEIVNFEADRITATINPPTTALVVLNEVDYPGWTPYVDGKEASALTANYILRAVVVEGGAHVIEWRFEPPRYPWLLSSWLLSLLAVVIAIVGPSKLRLLRGGAGAKHLISRTYRY